MKTLNYLCSSNKMRHFSEDIGNGVTEEWYKDPVSGEIAVVHTWAVPSDDCVDYEFDVVEIIPKGGYIGKLQELARQAQMTRDNFWDNLGI